MEPTVAIIITHKSPQIMDSYFGNSKILPEFHPGNWINYSQTQTEYASITFRTV